MLNKAFLFFRFIALKLKNIKLCFVLEATKMADEDYNKKLESLQQYIPFLDNMITQLRDPTKKNREQQLTKMESLHAMITDKRKR